MPEHGGGHHHMSPAIMKIEREHLWFALVGFGVIAFKFIHDGAFWRSRWAAHLWPGCMVVLGVLLTIYTE